MDALIFETRGEKILEELGIAKVEFARQMGVQRQNVKSLFKSKNIEVIRRAAEVMRVPWEMLAGYANEPDISEIPFPVDSQDPYDEIPMGNSIEDMRYRQRIIKQFYFDWLSQHEDKRIYNKSLDDFIYVKYISINETAGHAASNYLSTLAVLQLDEILPNAVLKASHPVDPKTNNQKGFSRMLVMGYNCPGLGPVRIIVGVKKSNGTNVQYCITSVLPSRKKEFFAKVDDARKNIEEGKVVSVSGKEELDSLLDSL